MSGFVRPEITAFWARWRAVLIGVALVAIGLLYGLSNLGLLRAVGLAVAAGGLAWLWDSLRRVRFPKAGGGPGIVDLVERRLRYFGPEWGGAVSLEDLARVRILTTQHGPLGSDMIWEFTDLEGQRLSIPSDAEGAAVIFDALTALRGVDYDAVTRASGCTQARSFVVWSRQGGLSDHRPDALPLA